MVTSNFYPACIQPQTTRPDHTQSLRASWLGHLDTLLYPHPALQPHPPQPLPDIPANMADSVTTIEYKGRVAILTIDNQAKLNALTQQQYYDIAKKLREVATHDEVYVTVLLAKGRYFSA